MDAQVELKVLRKLAAEYRKRAALDPTMATILVEIADGMDAKARELESASYGKLRRRSI